jgi:hypothetical protein
MLRVRFHLGLGKNFGKWKVWIPTEPNEIPFYADPSRIGLRLINCRLRNQTATANKIFDGADKTVCAWVDCEYVKAGAGVGDEYEPVRELTYNPRKNPFWTSSDSEDSLDGYKTRLIFSRGRRLFEGVLRGDEYV